MIYLLKNNEFFWYQFYIIFFFLKKKENTSAKTKNGGNIEVNDRKRKFTKRKESWKVGVDGSCTRQKKKRIIFCFHAVFSLSLSSPSRSLRSTPRSATAASRKPETQCQKYQCSGPKTNDLFRFQRLLLSFSWTIFSCFLSEERERVNKYERDRHSLPRRRDLQEVRQVRRREAARAQRLRRRCLRSPLRLRWEWDWRCSSCSILLSHFSFWFWILGSVWFSGRLGKWKKNVQAENVWFFFSGYMNFIFLFENSFEFAEIWDGFYGEEQGICSCHERGGSSDQGSVDGRNS